MRICISSVSVIGSLMLASTVMAAEDDSGATKGNDLRVPPARGMNNAISLLGSLGYRYSAGTGFGLSGRYQAIVVPDGFLTRTRIFDEFGIEGAFDYNHYSFGLLGYDWSYNEFALSAAAVWNVWFTENFAAYPKAGLGFAFGSWSDNDGFSNPGGYGGLFFVGGAGILYELDAITLRAEVSNASLHAGLAFSL